MPSRCPARAPRPYHSGRDRPTSICRSCDRGGIVRPPLVLCSFLIAIGAPRPEAASLSGTRQRSSVTRGRRRSARQRSVGLPDLSLRQCTPCLHRRPVGLRCAAPPFLMQPMTTADVLTTSAFGVGRPCRHRRSWRDRTPWPRQQRQLAAASVHKGPTRYRAQTSTADDARQSNADQSISS